MDVELAKSQFMSLVQNFASDKDRYSFFSWLKDDVIPEFSSQCCGDGRQRRNSEGILPATVMLDKIAGDIRNRVSLEAVMPSEQIVCPTNGEDASMTPVNTVHVDAFLYDEAGENELVDAGVLQRYYCQDCGSRNTQELTFVTHSCSKDRLEYIFRALLPPLEGKTILDVGSRIGAVLYGAYFHTKAAKIVGIEMNKELCALQADVVRHHHLQDRIQVIEGDVLNLPNVVRSADVIILNNVFDWFLPIETQIAIWRYLRVTLRTGCLIVSSPSLESSLQCLDTGIQLADWVIQRDLYDKQFAQNMEMEVEVSEVRLYQVMKGS